MSFNPDDMTSAEVTGTVIKVKLGQTRPGSRFAPAWKWTLKVDEETKVWSSIPKEILGDDPNNLVGYTFKFTATWHHADNDPHFWFGNRPHDVTMMTTEETEVAKTMRCPTCRGPHMNREMVNGRWTGRLIDRETGKLHECSKPDRLADLHANAELVSWPGVTMVDSTDHPHDFSNMILDDITPPINESAVRMIAEDVADKRLANLEGQLPKLATVAVSAASTDIEHRVRNEVDRLVPVEHIITVQNSDGTRESTIKGHPHPLLQTLVRLLGVRTPDDQRLNVMLVGPAGSGKTTAARQAAEALSLRYFEASMGPTTTPWNLEGYLSPDGTYVPGVMREAYENGGLLMLDEIDNSNPSILTTLNSAIGNGHHTFPDLVEVDRNPDFVLVVSGNTYGNGGDRVYVGRQQLDGAFLDRFAVLDWNYDEDSELSWAGADQADWVKRVQKFRRAASELQLRVIIGPRASILGAAMLRAGMKRSEAEQAVLWKGIKPDDRRKIEARSGGS